MNAKTLISAICILLALCLAIYFYAEWQKAQFDAALPVPPAADEQPGGHGKPDGDWKPADDAHDDTGDLIPSVDWQQHIELPALVKPGNLDELDAADPIAKAWAKLDYIMENPFAWGGTADPRTAGLVQQLTPIVDYLESEAHAEEIGALLDELADLRDPRSIETLIAYQCGGNIMSGNVERALIAMGPPVVPYLIPYLDDMGEGEEDPSPQFPDNLGSRGMSVASKVLGHIGAQHRAELDSIVEYILLPKLEALQANDKIMYPIAMGIKGAVARLKR